MRVKISQLEGLTGARLFAFIGWLAETPSGVDPNETIRHGLAMLRACESDTIFPDPPPEMSIEAATLIARKVVPLTIDLRNLAYAENRNLGGEQEKEGGS